MRLDMDIRCAFLDRFEKQRIDQPHDRGVVLLIEQIVHRRGAVGKGGKIGVGGGSLLGSLAGAVAVFLAHDGFEFGVVDIPQSQAGACDPLNLQKSVERQRRPVRAFHAAITAPAQDRAFAAGERVGKCECGGRDNRRFFFTGHFSLRGRVLEHRDILKSHGPLNFPFRSRASVKTRSHRSALYPNS